LPSANNGFCRTSFSRADIGKMRRAYQSEEDSNTATSPSVDELDDESDESDEYSAAVEAGADDGSNKESRLGTYQQWWEHLGPRTRQQNRIDYREKNIADIPFRPASPKPRVRESRKRPNKNGSDNHVKNKAPATSRLTAHHTRRQRRGAEERGSQSPNNPPAATHAFLDWIGEIPGPFRKPKSSTKVVATDPLEKNLAKMRVSGYGPSNGPSNNIVEEYLSPADVYTGDFQDFKGLSDSEKQAVIEKEAEEYGLEKPRGWNVSFHYNPHVEYHHFGSSHPMKPWRLTLTKQLVLSYGLEYTMDLYEPRPASFNELAIFHDREYLSYLSESVWPTPILITSTC
jgi:histone deacetylase HOS2